MSLTRLLVLIPVIFLLFDAAGSFIYGTDILVRSVTGLIGEPAQIGGRLGIFLIVMDTFLVGATLMVAAFGFYELFIVKTPGDRYWLPGWLRMRDLEDLKARVVSMLILVVAITFVDRTVESHDEQEVLFLGLGISIIIVALTVFLWFGKRGPSATGPDAVAATGGGGAGGGTGGLGNGDESGPDSGGAGSQPGRTSTRSRPGTASATLRSAVSSAAVSGSAVSAVARSEPRPALRLATAADALACDDAEHRPDLGQPDGCRRLAAILGIARRAGGSASAPGAVVAVAGYARVDLSDADLAGTETRLRANVVLGAVTIVVPPGTLVAESGGAVLGLRLGRGGDARAEGVRHHLLLSGFCVLGLVRVRCQPIQGAR